MFSWHCIFFLKMNKMTSRIPLNLEKVWHAYSRTALFVEKLRLSDTFWNGHVIAMNDSLKIVEGEIHLCKREPTLIVSMAMF